MHDVLEPYKDIHIKLEKDVYTKLKILCFTKRLTMTNVFEEFAALLVNEDPRCEKIIDNLVKKKAKQKLEKLEKRKISELDQDTIYNLLEDQSPLPKQKMAGEDDEDGID